MIEQTLSVLRSFVVILAVVTLATGCDKDEDESGEGGGGDNPNSEDRSGLEGDERDRLANSADRTVNMFSGDIVNPWLSAEDHIRVIAENAMFYYNGGDFYGDGQAEDPQALQFPDSMTLTPSAIPCGEEVAPTPALWEADTWSMLRFRVADLHRYSYQFDSVGSGAGAVFTATAFGDVDCDGVYSTFVRSGGVARNGNAFYGDLEVISREE